MKIFKDIFFPFKKISSVYTAILITLQIIVCISLWHHLSIGLIPSPFAIISKFFDIIVTKEFIDNLIASLGLTFQSMFYSIIIALMFGYLSVIPFFSPISKFIVKCRYLTLTGLIFIFTLLTKDGSSLKLSLLMFGIVPFFVTSLMSVISQIDRQQYDLCKTLRYNNWETLYEVIIIGKLDQTLEIIRQNFAISWLMITMVESLSMSEGGIGVMLFRYSKFNNLEVILSLQCVILLIGLGLDLLLGYLRHWLFPYTKVEQAK